MATKTKRRPDVSREFLRQLTAAETALKKATALAGQGIGDKPALAGDRTIRHSRDLAVQLKKLEDALKKARELAMKNPL